MIFEGYEPMHKHQNSRTFDGENYIVVVEVIQRKETNI